jgi:site-specific DNA recombinase
MTALENPHEQEPAEHRGSERMSSPRPSPGLQHAGIARVDESATSDVRDVGSKRAVIYLRVSTPSQVNTDYNPEGISIPAQREACERKILALDAEVVKEFIEPGRTATSIDKRPVFQETLAWVKAEKNIDYIVVYHFNRIFRNSIDAAITKRDLAKCGARVVSTVLDMGESPESMMVETIIHAVDQYQSQASGADISYKMAAKARNGGTLGRAPLGYLNQRDTSEGRNIGIVIADPERAQLVQTAFELYATGDFSLDTLADELTDRGLRTRPGRCSAGPISTSKLAELLRDRYYIGYVHHKGDEFPGRHDALITDELFERVQDILDVRGGKGVRRRKHHHYLKGSVWCGQCHKQGRESRMIMQLAKGNGGTYEYFFCRRRQDHVCDSRFVELGALEEAVADYYATIRFPAKEAEIIRQVMHEALADEERVGKLLHQQLNTELARLDTQEENLLDLVADGAVTSPKAKTRLAKIHQQQERVRQQLDTASHNLAAGAALVEAALKLLDHPMELYRSMGPKQRQLLNLAIFEKLYVIDDYISDAVFNPPFDELIRVQRALASREDQEAAGRSNDFGETEAGGLAGIFLGDGLSKPILVEVSGLEPPTSTLRT